MKRPLSHRIEEEAKRVFESSLPVGWAYNPQYRDYAKDYLVEMNEGEHLAGVTFFVQLKGQQKLALSKDGNHATFWMEKKYAVYYADKVKQPVFLVLIDVTQRTGYWVFIQRYLLKDLGGKNWRTKGTVPIRVPTANNLADAAKLRSAVEEANRFMLALHPTSIRASLRSQRLSLESLDPRLGIRIKATEEREHYLVQPKEAVDVRLTFKGEPDTLMLKMDDLFGKGLPTSFGPDEVEVAGSPLFEEILRHGGTLQWTQEFHGMVSLVAKDAADGELGRLDSIPGKLTGGSKECRFEGSLAGSPLSLHITSKREGGNCPIQFRFDFKQWHGQPVSLLGYFDQIVQLFQAAKACASLDIECFLQGNPFFGGRIQHSDLGFVRAAADVLATLEKARQIARRFGISPVLPSDFGPEHAGEIEELDRLLTEGEYRRKLSEGQLKIKLGRAGVRKLLATSNTRPGDLILNSLEPQRRFLLGQGVEVGRLEHHFTRMRLASSKKDLQRRVSRSGAPHIEVVFASSDQSELIVRRVAEGMD